MTRYGLSNWPPVWIPADPKGNRSSLRGEIGRLKYVLFRESDNTCFLVTMHDGGGYVGSLLFDDRAFCQQLGRILETCTGRTIKEIGDLDLSHLL
jgi:hypothetical protein